MIDFLAQQIQQKNLPGANAHRIMSPNGRLIPNEERRKSARESAVLILLHEKQNDTFCTLIQRPEYNGTHSRQVAFPGGKRESNETLETTALRETHEEVGIRPEQVQVIGELTQIYIPPSNFLVNPFVGFLNEIPSYIPDNHEVDEVFEFPISMLLSKEIVKEKRIKITNGMFIQAPYFEIQNKTVWGATAAILSELKEILKKH